MSSDISEKFSVTLITHLNIATDTNTILIYFVGEYYKDMKVNILLLLR